MIALFDIKLLQQMFFSPILEKRPKNNIANLQMEKSNKRKKTEKKTEFFEKKLQFSNIPFKLIEFHEKFMIGVFFDRLTQFGKLDQ